jgi:hypothetical protein
VSPGWGSNRQLRPDQVDRACLQLVQQLAAQDNKQDVPTDIVDFMHRAKVVLLDANNQPVTIARAIVTWDS